MASNDKIILDEILKARQAEVDPDASASDYFELFTAEQILKDYDLSYDEIESGLIGDGGDGGIDSVYLFVNDELVHEDPDYTHLKKNPSIDLVVIQSKTASGFQETPVERFLTVSDDILDLSKPVDTLGSVYNEGLCGAISRFRTVFQQLAPRFPTLSTCFHYACKGSDPAPTVRRKVQKLEAVVKNHFPTAIFSLKFVGASELLALARRRPQTTYTLQLAENPVSSAGQVGFLCLVKLRDFNAFITDKSGVLHRQIFEANVRDYQGRTEVNDEIQKSLKEKNPEDFWWLNNGVSILASKASQSGKTLTIEDPQIVNGLQTSTEIYNYCKSSNTDDDERKLLVRVIVPAADDSRDRIIKATNSQTAVQQASLRATDKIHRDIEEFLRPRGLFYDRRKNYYKNDGKPRDKIIGIPYLAQAVMAVVLQKPDVARGRPSSLLKKDEDYKKVYSELYPVELYFVCVEAMRRVETRLKSAAVNLPRKDRNNLRFYVLMHAVSTLSGEKTPGLKTIAGLDPTAVTDSAIDASLKVVRSEYEKLGGTDQVAKGPSLRDAVLGAL
jgi:hypothetical protein